MKVPKNRNMKAQANIVEYVLMTFFILIIIVGLILFLSNWQLTQLQLSGNRDYLDRAVELADTFLNSLYFIKGTSMVVDPMLDDSKLMALNMTQGICERLQNIYGPNWFIEIEAIDSPVDKNCTSNNYPDCNSWSFCKDESGNKESAFIVLPVNIYRKLWERTDIGTLKVGVYAYPG